MAYNLCYSPPASLFHDHRQPLCNNNLSSLKPSTRNLFTYSPLKPNSVSFHSKAKISHVSLHEATTEESQGSDSQNPDGKPKTYIWVNPKSPRASLFRKKSYDSRYASLVKAAESLNSCESNEKDVFDVLIGLGSNMIMQDAVVVINNMMNRENALLVLKYFEETMKLTGEVILYNVTLKVFRKNKDLEGAEKLFDQMLQRGIKPDNVTFSTIISAARMSGLPGKAVEWFEKMPSFGCDPDDVTYSAIIDAYGRSGNVDKAMSFYDRARAEKWRLDPVTFSTVIRIYGMSGNYDGCLNVHEEMKALGVKPTLVTYNTLLDAMGRAKRPWQAKSIYKEMIDNGLTPSWVTYVALLRAYCKARYGEDALSLYKEMKEKGLELNAILYNTVLSMCADVGFTDEALEIYEDMKNSESCKPDSFTFSSLITIYSCCGKVSEAEGMLNAMMEAGFEPNIFVLTSLIQCYGKAQRTDDVVRTVNQLLDLGITPDERFCGCLLNVMTQTPKEELHKLTECVEKADSKLGNVVKFLMGNLEGDFKEEASQLLSSIGRDVKKAYCNCLIDLCVNLNQLERACELLDLGLKLDIYIDLQSRSATQWSLYLKSLSLGAALTALHVWINDLTKALESEEELPPVLGINTGHGKHKFSDKGLAGVFESHLKELNAPFHEAPDKVGWFLTTSDAAKSWLESRSTAEVAVV
ncbi:pentatricopeptide repeat-containing protein At4g16390, chloroplastic [Rutidosis leptorrhynchoides]|uniref:pentatricopeptide repeat-containing protein At4g16390, chloroplastic n=1 Tax=Rutidosis leptorrhynchoides TaxID=125765 RepID=UPI003A9A4219